MALMMRLLEVMKRRYKLIFVIFVVFMIILFKFLPSSDPTFTSSLPSQNLVYNNACSLFTLNIWFGNYKTAQRMELLGTTIERLRPSIITFQEVTSKNLGYLQQQTWFARYTMIPNKLPEGHGYGVVILTVHTVINWRSVPFRTSQMGRSLLLAELKVEIGIREHTAAGKSSSLHSRGNRASVKNVHFTIATAHLESMAYSSLEREKQLQDSLDILNEYNDVCLMGDLNLELKVDGQIILPHTWFDAWLSIKNNTHTNGFTWDPAVNPNIKLSEPDSIADRFDRVLCKLMNFGIESVDIVGTEPHEGIFFSDHYALHTRMNLVSSKMKAHQLPLVKRAKFTRPKNWQKYAKQY